MNASAAYCFCYYYYRIASPVVVVIVMYTDVAVVRGCAVSIQHLRINIVLEHMYSKKSRN